MKLLIFTQKVDKNDSNLGFFHDWILEFAKHFETVDVICYGKGSYDVPKNVHVHSLGKEVKAGNFAYAKNSIKYLYQLNGKYDRVFVHMNPAYLVLFGWYWKLRGTPAYLWYVHRSVDLKLRIAVMFTKKIFSSAKESFRIKTDKVVFLGHGIDVDIFPNTFHIYTGNTLKIVHIGRITQIKNIEIAISAVHELNKYSVSAELTLFGVCETEADKSYKKVLENLIIEKGLVGSVLFAGGIIHTDLASKLSNSHIAVNMTPPGGMDKVVLESLLVGIPAFTSNTAFNCLFREYENLFFYNFRDSVELSKKIYNFIQMQNRQDITEILSNRVRNNFSLTVLVEKMVNIMK